MIKDTTINNLVLLAYNELPEIQASILKREMEINEELNIAYSTIQRDINRLDTVSYAPHPTSVQIVLEESCSASPMEMI